MARHCVGGLAGGGDGGGQLGICGEAPSNYPDFAHFLVDKHIDTISLNPDSVIGVIERIGNRGEKA